MGAAYQVCGRVGAGRGLAPDGTRTRSAGSCSSSDARDHLVRTGEGFDGPNLENGRVVVKASPHGGLVGRGLFAGARGLNSGDKILYSGEVLDKAGCTAREARTEGDYILAIVAGREYVDGKVVADAVSQEPDDAGVCKPLPDCAWVERAGLGPLANANAQLANAKFETVYLDPQGLEPFRVVQLTKDVAAGEEIYLATYGRKGTVGDGVSEHGRGGCAVCGASDAPMVPCGHVCEWCFAVARAHGAATLARWMRMHGLRRDDGAALFADRVRRGCPCCGATHDAAALFRPEERSWWEEATGRSATTWTRQPERRRAAVVLEVRTSAIPGAGLGLFTTCALEEGTPLGRLSGRVLHTGAHGACEAWAVAHRDTHSVLVRHGGAWAVVDVRGSPFAFANSAADETMHVGECGDVECAREVAAGEELVWDYGDRYDLP